MSLSSVPIERFHFSQSQSCANFISNFNSTSMSSAGEASFEHLGLHEDARIELEALWLTYHRDEAHLHGDVAPQQSNDFPFSSIRIGPLPQLDATGAIVELPLIPRNASHVHEAFVAATLALSIDGSYPHASSPLVSFKDVRGLDDADQSHIVKTLREEADEMQGELVLGQLCELALDLVTRWNRPIGSCAFCLEPLRFEDESLPQPPSGAHASAHSVAKLPCFHVFHCACFGAWFSWQQGQHAQRAQQLQQEYKSMAQEKLREEGLWCESVPCGNGVSSIDVWAVKCPSCRVEVCPRDLRHVLPQLTGFDIRAPGANGRAETQHLRKPGKETAQKPQQQQDDNEWRIREQQQQAPQRLAQVLPPDTLEHVLELQRRCAVGLEAQRQRGGLVEQGVAVSLAEVQAALDSARISENAAAAAAAACDETRDGDGASTSVAARAQVATDIHGSVGAMHASKRGRGKLRTGVPGGGSRIGVGTDSDGMNRAHRNRGRGRGKRGGGGGDRRGAGRRGGGADMSPDGKLVPSER
jgi:hypothetical protein